MFGYINGVNFFEMEAMKYYAPPSTWADEKKKTNVQSKIYSGDWEAAEKKDGFFAKFIKDEDGNLILTARNRNTAGKFVNKIEWVPHLVPYLNSLPNGTCLLAELYFPARPGSKEVQTVMGCLKEKAIARQSSGDKIHFYAFDCLAYNGDILYNTAHQVRIEYLNTVSDVCGPTKDLVTTARYYAGDELWIVLQTILANGGEGMVLMHKNGVYEPGKRPSKTTLKVKKELENTIDCFFTGRILPPTREYTGKEINSWMYWQNMTTGEFINENKYKEYHNGEAYEPVTKGYFYHWAGSLEIGVIHEGAPDKVVPIGFLSGLTDEIKANYKDYAMKPIEVTAMELDRPSTGTITLRHGKMKGFRPDLTINDCTFEKI